MGCSRPGTPKAWHVPGLEHARMAHPGTEYANMAHPGTEFANMAHPNMEDEHVAPLNRPDGDFPDTNIIIIIKKSKSTGVACFGSQIHQN